MIEKKIVLMYGEQTVQKSYRIPKSKFKEIDEAIKELLSKYEDPKTVVVFCKSKTKITGEVQDMKPIIDLEIKNKAPEWATKHKEVLRPTSEISNFKSRVLSELPRDAVSYKKSTKKFHSATKDVWYSKCYVDGKWEILEFEDFDSMEKYFEDKINQLKNK